jgi:crossover junction endodeoxyribonuclease RusA
MTFTLPEPPSSNRYWRVFRGHAVTSAEARAYKKRVAVMLHAKVRPPTGPVSVTVSWYRSRKSGDLDNRLKVTLDALKGIAFRDDKQVTVLHAYRFDDKKNPRVEVTVTEAEQ